MKPLPPPHHQHRRANHNQHRRNDEGVADLPRSVGGVPDHGRHAAADKCAGEGGGTATEEASKSECQKQREERERDRSDVHGYLPTARRTSPRTDASTLSLMSMIA